MLELVENTNSKIYKKNFFRFYLLDRRLRWVTFCAICANESERWLLSDVFDSSNDELWSYIGRLFPLIIVVGKIEFDGWWIIPVNCCVVIVVVSLVNVANRGNLIFLVNI